MERKVAEDISCKVLLHDGVLMPMFGLGMSKCTSGAGQEAETAVVHALKKGYRLIDTAARYWNEDDVGRAVKKSGMAREELFVVTKLWSENHGYKNTIEAFHQSLLRLDLDYVDLYLVHSPYCGKIVESYKAMLHLQKQGLIRSIGVSNFLIEHLEGLKDAGMPRPTVNQIELHPWQRKQEVVDYCHSNGIVVMGYSPLAKATHMHDPLIKQLGKKHGKTYAQVLIRWSVQKGYITIPKSAKPHRIEENAQVFDWALSDADMQQLGTLEEWTCGWDPVCPWVD